MKPPFCVPALLSLMLLAHAWAAPAAVPPTAATSKAAVDALEAWLKTPRESRKPVAEAPFSKTALTKADAERARKLLWDDHAEFIRQDRAAEMTAKAITNAGTRMKFEVVRFGPDTAPAGGRSLFISMHGGGGAPAAVNEDQWRNQIKLAEVYKASEGIYVAPRAPGNDWNLWHESRIDGLFERLIENMIVLEGVNPNRVYILGYSAGGDGVYQLAPRMADRLAAASMMAGHPNEASPIGLRNIGFAIQVGANDDAYNRNKVAAEWGEKLDKLASAEPGAYAHFTELHAGCGHWMNTQDRKAIPWMEKFTRQPLPTKIAWHQDDVTHDRFYWLSVPAKSAQTGQEIFAERKGQSFSIETKAAAPSTDPKETAKPAPAPATVTVLLNDTMVNLDEPVSVTAGTRKFSGKAARTIATLARTLEERGDPDLVFSAEVTLEGLGETKP